MSTKYGKRKLTSLANTSFFSGVCPLHYRSVKCLVLLRGILQAFFKTFPILYKLRTCPFVPSFGCQRLHITPIVFFFFFFSFSLLIQRIQTFFKKIFHPFIQLPIQIWVSFFLQGDFGYILFCLKFNRDLFHFD